MLNSDTSLFSKYIDEDYKTINACKKFLLPKVFGERKFFTAYIRKATRCNIRLTEMNCLEIWNAAKEARLAGLTREKRKRRAKDAVTSSYLYKFAKLWQQALIDSEQNGQIGRVSPSDLADFIHY